MSTNLFYFSSTGNSLVVARDLAEKLPDTKLYAIPSVINGEIDLDAENIGLIFPVYFMGMPRIVADFIGKLPVMAGKYIFAVYTCGAISIGAPPQAQRLLKRKNIKLNAGFSITMPGNYLVKYGAFSQEKQAALFAREQAKIDRIAEIVRQRKDARLEMSIPLLNGLAAMLYKSQADKFPTLDRNFMVDERCNGCGICAKVCPVGNIDMTGGKPHWQGHCQHCVGCMQWCPTEAIQYGTKTQSRKRYHHPKVSVKDLIQR